MALKSASGLGKASAWLTQGGGRAGFGCVLYILKLLNGLVLNEAVESHCGVMVIFYNRGTVI